MQEALLMAIKSGDIDRCRAALNGGADVDIAYAGMMTPLQAAVTKNEEAIARLLLERGADPLIVYEGNGRSVLHVVAARAQVELCRMLAVSKALLNLTDNDGSISLCDAAENGRAGVVEMLLSDGARVDVCTNSGTTALHKAIERNDMASCRLLVAHGLFPSICLDRDVLDIDCLNRRQVVRPPFDYLTPMQLAILLDREEIVRYFVEECGEDVEQLTMDGRATRHLTKSSPRVASYIRALRTQAAVAGAVGSSSEACQNSTFRSGPSPR